MDDIILNTVKIPDETTADTLTETLQRINDEDKAS